MNRAVIIGRLTRDVETKQAGETTVARFTLAVDRQKAKGEADFISCVAFGKTAESLERWTEKGKRLAVEGHIQTGSYTNKDGNKVYTTDVIVDRADFIDFREQVNPYQRVPVGTQQSVTWRQNAEETSQRYREDQGYQQQTWNQAPQQEGFVPVPEQEGFVQVPDDLDDEGLPFN